MEHFVPMSTVPPGFDIPAEFADRLYFDPDGHRLVHRGFMSQAEFDRLSQLSDDWSFRRALEDLFRLCAPEEKGRRPALARLVASIFHLGL